MIVNVKMLGRKGSPLCSNLRVPYNSAVISSGQEVMHLCEFEGLSKPSPQMRMMIIQ